MTTIATPELAKILDELVHIVGNDKTKNLWKYMLNVTQVPRGSNPSQDNLSNSVKIRTALVGWAKQLGYEPIVDKGLNIIIRKPASAGFESLPSVCLQCHMDMVTEAENDYKIDFLNEPIKPYIDDKKEYLRAYKTSLGGDDGAGIAACFSILEDKTLKHPPIEILVTRDEETGLYGAAALESGILQSKYLINVDSEEWKSVCVGCAGGFTYKIKHAVVRDTTVTSNITKKIILSGLHGGHSGVNIDMGRINAVTMMGRLLSNAKNTGFLVCTINGGSAHNSIPRECTCVVSVPPHQSQLFDKLVKEEYELVKVEYTKIDPNISIDISSVEFSAPLNSVESSKLVNYLNCVEVGPIRWNPDVAGLVDTSHNIGVINVCECCIQMTGSCRAFADSQLQWMYRWITSYCQMAGYSISEKIGEYPGWKPEPENLLNTIVIDESKKAYKTDNIKVYAIHAGLECGLFIGKYPHLICSSIGPELNFPHTPNERLLIKSVEPFYYVLVNSLERLTKSQ